MAGVTLCNMAGYTITMLSVLLVVLSLLDSVQGCNVAESSCRNGTCYYVNTEGMMWQSALEHCNNTCNGRLAVVKDNDTQKLLHNLTSSVVWLGGKEVNLRDWMWIDQQGALTATSYTNWSGLQSSPMIGQQPDSNKGNDFFQPAVALMRVRNNPDKFPWVDREFLQTQQSGVICEAGKQSQVCKGNHNFHWIQNNSRWTDIKDGTCVFISTSEVGNWFEGHRLCREAGGKLLKIDNDTVQKNLENRLNNNSGPQYYWIGLVHSVWRWGNDDPINLMFWRQMYPPEKKGPACLALEGAASDATRSWVMKACSETLPYICEYPLEATTWSTTMSAEGSPAVTSDAPMTSMPTTKIVTVNPSISDNTTITGATTLSTEGNRPVTSDAPMTSRPATKIETLNPSTTDYRTTTDGSSVTPISMTDDVYVTSAVTETVTVRGSTDKSAEVPHTGRYTVEAMDGMIAGIAVGCSLVIILVIVGVGFWWRRKRKTNTHITKASVQYTDEAAGSYYDHVATEDGLDSQRPKRETRPYYKGLVTRAAYDSKQAKHGGQAQTGSAEIDNVTNENIVVGGTNGVDAGHRVSDRNSNMIGSGTYASIDRDDGADLNADFGRSFGTYSTMDDVNVPHFTSLDATKGMGREPPSSDNDNGNKVTDSALSEDDISQLYGKVDMAKKKKYRQQHEGNPDDTIDEIEMTENDIYGE